MNSGFAGSASHDDRRRRRLLTEQSGDGLDCSALAISRGVAESSRNHRYPVKRVLHYKLWRMWFLAFAMFTMLGALLYGAWITSERDLGPAMELLFSQAGGRIYPVIFAGLLFLSGQLSWLIGWARSRGPNDFRGQFRVWSPIGLSFFLMSAAVLIRVDSLLEVSISHAGLELPWTVAEWNWMIPLAGLSLILVFAMNIEMRTSRIARIHLWLGILTVTAGMGLAYVPQISVPSLVQLGMTLGGLMLITLSLLWFGRQVLYISADPAEKKTSLIGRILKSLLTWKPGTPKPKKEQKAKSSMKEKKPAATTKSSRRRGRKSKTTKQLGTAEKVAAETVIEEKSAEEEPETKPAEKPRIQLRAEDITVTSVDADLVQERLDMMELLAEEGEPFDQDLLKGLTKKQKKQMRSAWRDLERQHSTRRAG